ncbi:TRAP transporter substrate-binding protein [Salinicola rhizosphaerae]|uniref:C4-dicarboxylate ABC transporter substrate-binding protein n=1 Tax=Salinicola rhizosphaerae TaxID=1443141 RepID=A0ABQ3DR65_9GAMM|nr:TRAP transporter substrate-binding protein [Salinicola rhizosphaerae]GHB11200.1 C4-dicarboxylate ABC transporter substrate-binding protein [Salinicola rhizosphaerae]
MSTLTHRIAITTGILLLSLTGAAQAETQWIMATGYPQESFFTKNIEKFIEEIETKSHGELTINLRANGTLIKHDAIKRAVQTGQVQIGEIRPSVYGNEDPMYILDSLPGVATTYKQAHQLMEAQAPFFEKLFGKQNIVPLAYVAWPGQGFFTQMPLNSVDDMKGKKIRIYSQPTREMAEQLGFQATILPFAEIAQAYSTGMIDSLFTSPQTGIDVQIWDYAKDFTYTGTMHTKNAIIVNERALDSLDASLQKIVKDAGKHATERGWLMSQEAAGKNNKIISEHGVAISQASDDIQKAISDIGDSMLEAWRKSAPPEEQEVLDNYLEVRNTSSNQAD